MMRRSKAVWPYSLVGTAKLNGIDPEGHLRYVLTHIADHPVNRVHELLPWKLDGPGQSTADRRVMLESNDEP
jgi:transposase IS66-like protein